MLVTAEWSSIWEGNSIQWRDYVMHYKLWWLHEKARLYLWGCILITMQLQCTCIGIAQYTTYDVITRSLGNPKRKVWCSRAAVSLDYKTKVINPVGLGEGLARCQSTLALIDQRRPALCPNETERLSISPACRKQRINCADVKYEESELWPASKWWWKAIKKVVSNVGK